MLFAGPSHARSAGRFRRAALAGGLAGCALAGCAAPGQLGHPLPAPVAPAPVAAPAPLPVPDADTDPAVLREPVTGTVDARVTIRTPGPAVYAVRTVVLEPGEVVGWRRHPGTVLAVVRSGSVTLRRQGACGPADYTSGEALFVGDALAHRLSNDGDEPAELLVTTLLAPGAPESTDADDACAPD